MTPTPIQWRFNSDDNARLSLYEQTLTPVTHWNEFLSPSPSFTVDATHRCLRADTLALILASRDVGLPFLDPSNIDEWLYRLHLLYSINEFYRFHATPEGPTGYPFDIATLERNCGLCFPAQPYILTPTFHSLFRRRFLSLSRTSIWTPTHATRQPLQ